MLAFGRYLASKGKEVDILGNTNIKYLIDPRDVETINGSVALWLNGVVFTRSCEFADYVRFTFNIPGSSLSCHVRMKLENMDTDFMRWLFKFVKLNNIKIPHVEAFFSMLIYQTLDSKEVMKFPNDIDTFERIAKVRDTICGVLMRKCNKDYTDLKEEFSDKLSDFEGDIHFEPMDMNPGIESVIVIQSLKVEQ